MIHRLIRSKPVVARLAALAVATVAVAAAACGNFTGVPASLPTITDSGAAYAINGAPLGAPTALHVFSGQLISADADFLFDIAFDLDANGNVIFLPQRAVASGLATTHAVALQKDTVTAFEAIGRAPSGGYRADTALTVRRNQVVLAQVTDASACGFSLTGTTLYAKIVVRSIDPVNRRLTLRYTVDPNCGFRSFASGIPKD